MSNKTLEQIIKEYSAIEDWNNADKSREHRQAISNIQKLTNTFELDNTELIRLAILKAMANYDTELIKEMINNATN